MRRGGSIVTFALHLMLCLSVSFWSLNSAPRHEPAQTFEQAAMAVELADHGHSHGDALDLAWLQHGHAHDVADHDHNSALTPPAVSLTHLPGSRRREALPDRTASPPPNFGFERPPRALLL
jgi:hypothetical protein